MQWSKLKARVESFFAPSVAGRVELRTTHYRHADDGEGRGWITIDRSEVYNFCTLKYWVERNALSADLRSANRATDFMDPEQQQAYYDAGREAERILVERGILSQGWFEASLAAYLTLAITDALASDDLVHRALAVLDGRLGKRRLRSFELRTNESPLVKRLLDLRCEAEGVRRAAGANGCIAEPDRQRRSSRRWPG